MGETGHFLSILNRALFVIQAIRRQLADFSTRFRADSAFCVPEVIAY